MSKFIFSIFLFLSSLVSADVFEKGKTSVGIVAGASSSNGDNYTVIGVGVDYFVVNGLSVSGGYRGWFGDGPSMNQITVGSSYYLPVTQKFHPYIGAFVRETFVSGEDDYTSYGGRGGVAITMSPNSFMSFGYVYEEYGSCSETIYEDCSSSYPEIVFSLAF